MAGAEVYSPVNIVTALAALTVVWMDLVWVRDIGGGFWMLLAFRESLEEPWRLDELCGFWTGQTLVLAVIYHLPPDWQAPWLVLAFWHALLRFGKWA